MSETVYRTKLESYRLHMFRSLEVDVNTAEAYFNWMDGQLAEMDREKQKEAIAGPPTVRQQLRKIYKLIVTYSPSIVKGAK